MHRLAGKLTTILAAPTRDRRVTAIPPFQTVVATDGVRQRPVRFDLCRCSPLKAVMLCRAMMRLCDGKPGRTTPTSA